MYTGKEIMWISGYSETKTYLKSAATLSIKNTYWSLNGIKHVHPYTLSNCQTVESQSWRLDKNVGPDILTPQFTWQNGCGVSPGTPLFWTPNYDLLQSWRYLIWKSLWGTNWCLFNKETNEYSDPAECFWSHRDFTFVEAQKPSGLSSFL